MTWQAYYQNVTPQAVGKVESFWWRDVCSLITTFRGVAACSPGNGASALFWKDNWSSNLLAEQFPRLFSFALDSDVSLQSLLHCENIEHLAEHFAIPISEQAYQELTQVAEILSDMKQDISSRLSLDSWTFSHSSGVFAPAAFYKFMFAGLHVSHIFTKLWKSKCLLKQKVFVWLFLVDRLNTRDMIDRRHWHLDSGVNCAMCNLNQRETRDHLFFNCVFAANCWRKLGISWSSSHGMDAMFERAKGSFSGPKFFEVATCALWGIWKQRNGLIFEKKQPSIQAWRAVFKKDLSLVVHRIKPKHKEALATWVDSF